MFWVEARKRAIKNTKRRIKHMEAHGNGKTAMEEKSILQKQERHHELMRNKIK